MKILLSTTEVCKPIIDRLNGFKVLVRGNHDKGIDACYNAGFDVVMNSGSMIIANELVTLTHCPLCGLYREDTTSMKGRVEGENWHGENRHPDFSIDDYGQFHLHGHIHSPNKGQSQKILGRQYDVGAVGNNYRPIHISVIDTWIQKTKWLEKRGEL